MKLVKTLIPLIILTSSFNAYSFNIRSWLSRSFETSDKKYTRTLKEAFTVQLKVNEIKVLADNDLAFKAKLEAIESAEKSLDLIYYIYSNDESSDHFSKKLIDAARSGVKVRLLVDYHANYKNLDMFSALENEVKNKIEVRFYNRPTKNIVKDAFYLTTACKGPINVRSCQDEKSKKIEKIFKNERFENRTLSKLNISNLNNGFSGLFLSGLYSKSPLIMANAILQGQQIDLGQFSGEGGVTAEDKEELKKLLRLYIKTKMSSGLDQVSSKIELGLAGMVYGDKVTSMINTFDSLTPFGNRNKDVKRTNDWDFITDYIHHKFLLSDHKIFISGGRNIENSYHMSPNKFTKKYIFMDTDTSIKIKSGGDKLQKSFDELWNFKEMVATMSEVRAHAPNDLFVHTKLYKEECALAKDSSNCIMERYKTSFVTVKERESNEIENIKKGSLAYLNEYKKAGSRNKWEREFIISDTKKLTVGYIENLPYKRGASEKERRRSYGASGEDNEGSSSKNIHHVWKKAIQNTCKKATSKKPKEIIFHNAYVFTTSNMIKLLGEISDGTTDCGNVSVKIITNSFTTTDLNIVNQMAKYQMKAFFDYYKKNRDSRNGADIKYFEYKSAQSKKGQYSLHSKVSIFGDEVIIGSANLDVRSYMMDTNNSLYFKGATDFVKDYSSFLNSILEDDSLIARMDNSFESTGLQAFQAQDEFMINALIDHYKLRKRVSEKTLTDLKKGALKVLIGIYKKTSDILNYKKKIFLGPIDSNRNATREKKEYEESLDKFNNLFKLI